ncbi:MAG: ABC transporter ATP-binding protein [Planctomycetes bacterium]|nr:ABC transporter ATP-binding protein [Planctomycetota bacterium]
MRLRASGLQFDYGGAPVLAGVSLELREGQLLGLVGPNGAGKSTLLSCLHGGLKPSTGNVRLEGVELEQLSRREVARAIAVVPQRCEVAFPVSVEHFVGLGRFAYSRFLGGQTQADLDAVEVALERMQLERLRRRAVDQLSGGEFRRVLIAQALAQEPRIMLFDEPVQQLDLRHQLEVMEFAREFARGAGQAALIVLHDLGLAARYCDELALLHRGRIVASGAPASVLTETALGEVWNVRAAIERSPATGALQIVAISPLHEVSP